MKYPFAGVPSFATTMAGLAREERERTAVGNCPVCLGNAVERELPAHATDGGSGVLVCGQCYREWEESS